MHNGCQPGDEFEAEKQRQRAFGELSRYLPPSRSLSLASGTRLALLRLGLRYTLLLSVFALLAALRFVDIGSRSLWADELFSVFWAKSGAIYVVSHAADETNPPLYYLLLNLWMNVFGESESTVRLLSACVSTVTIPLVYVLGNTLFGRTAGVISALLFGLSQWHLYFAQEARVFALLNLVFAILMLTTVGVTARLKGGSSATGALFSPPGLGLLLSGIVACYLHYVAFLMLVTIALAVVLTWWQSFSFDRKYFSCYTIIGAVVGLLSAPAVILAFWERNSPSVSWMASPSVTKFVGMITGAPAWDRAPEWVLGAVVLLSASTGLLWGAIFVYGAWSHRYHPHFILVYLLPVLGFSILTLVTIVQPFLFPRTALWISIPVYLGLGGAVTAFRYEGARAIAAAVVILTSATFTLGHFEFSRDEEWRARGHRYGVEMATGDLLILGQSTPAVAFVYYNEERLLPQLRRWRGGTTSADKLDERVTGIRPIADSEIAAAIHRGVKVLFVSRECETPRDLERSMLDLLFRCDAPVPSGWTLVHQFLSHIKRGIFDAL
jgi:uncharacterized membrane protein